MPYNLSVNNYRRNNGINTRTINNRGIRHIYNRLFCKKTYYLKDLNNLKNNNYQKEDNVNAVRYKFVNHPNKYDK